MQAAANERRIIRRNRCKLVFLPGKLLYKKDGGALSYLFGVKKADLVPSKGVQPQKAHSGSFRGTFYGIEPKIS